MPQEMAFCAAMPRPRSSGSSESAMSADLAGSWKTTKPCRSAATASNSQLGASAYIRMTAAERQLPRTTNLTRLA